MNAPSRIETTPATQPYDSREETIEAFASHVDRGKARALAAIGVDLVIGERQGARFRDAYTGRAYWNCHCNGGVFNLGHRNPAVIGAIVIGSVLVGWFVPLLGLTLLGFVAVDMVVGVFQRRRASSGTNE